METRIDFPGNSLDMGEAGFAQEGSWMERAFQSYFFSSGFHCVALLMADGFVRSIFADKEETRKAYSDLLGTRMDAENKKDQWAVQPLRTHQPTHQAYALYLEASYGLETLKAAGNMIAGIFDSIKTCCQKYETILDAFDFTEEAISVLDKEGRYIYANKRTADLFHISKKDILGRSILDLAKLEMAESQIREMKVIEVLRQGRSIIEKESHFDLLNRGKLHIVNSMYPVMNSDGQVTGVCDIFKTFEKTVQSASKFVGYQAVYYFEDILGNSTCLSNLVEEAKRYARSDCNVLILGESGTGKELFAQSIHNFSHRAKGPFVAVNCANFPNELIDSELFGYEEGAFTGAQKGGKPGKFELADGGTIFLDEIGEMPFHLQAKLLRTVETKMISRLGSKTQRAVDVRIIAATNRDLKTLTDSGTFREDLYYRLCVFTLRIPPLRARREDIALLARRFLEKRVRESLRGELTFSKEALAFLQQHDWKGNIRELQNLISRIAVTCDKDVVSLEFVRRCLYTEEKDPVETLPIRCVLQDRTTEELVRALEEAGGNKELAARKLGVSKRTLYRMIKKIPDQTEGL